MDKIFIRKTSSDLASDINEELAKILCSRCKLNYVSWDLYSQYFSHAGCDEHEGEERAR